MHPQLGAAVKDHSIFFTERLPRLFRSLYPIGGVVFDGDRAPQTGAEVRDYHVGIKGVDEQGRRYNALNPDVFYWAHATFFMGTILTAEHFGDGLTEDQKRQLFDEHVTWYRMYGMSMRPVPRDLGGLPGLLGPHVPGGAGEHLGGAGRAGPVHHAETPFAAMDSGLAVGAATQGAGTLRGVADGRPLRRAGAGPDGLLLVRRTTRGCTGCSAGLSTWRSSSCRGARRCIRGRGSAGTAPRAAALPTHRWCTRRRAICPPIADRGKSIHYSPPVGVAAARSLTSGLCIEARISSSLSSAAFCRASNCWAAVRPSRSLLGQFGCAQGGSEPGLDLLPHAFQRRHARRWCSRCRGPGRDTRWQLLRAVSGGAAGAVAADGHAAGAGFGTVRRACGGCGVGPRPWGSPYSGGLVGRDAAGPRFGGDRHAVGLADVPGSATSGTSGVSICQASHGSAAAKAFAANGQSCLPPAGTTAQSMRVLVAEAAQCAGRGRRIALGSVLLGLVLECGTGDRRNRARLGHREPPGNALVGAVPFDHRDRIPLVVRRGIAAEESVDGLGFRAGVGGVSRRRC